MVALAGILLALAACWVILSPLVQRIAAPLSDGPDRVAELREVCALRDVAYETLRDIEFDFHAGKISEADYQDLSERYKGEALRLVQRIDALTAAGSRPAAALPPQRPPRDAR